MYIVKNAFRCVSRSKGRNVLIGIIALVIAIAACIGLSIRQAADSARETALEGMSVTATIGINRGNMMSGMMGGGMPGGGMPGGGGSFPENFEFDKDAFAGMMGSVTALTLTDYQKYATASTVKDFYYTVSASFNGGDGLEAVTTDSGSSSGGSFDFGNMFGGGRGASGDFTVIGYSGDIAMTDFINGTSKILESDDMDGGVMFDEGTTDAVCVISEELALYNGIAVGDKITLTNPRLDTEYYLITVCGIYETTSASSSYASPGQDPANRIYMSSAALDLILESSDLTSVTITDSDSGRSQDSAITGSLEATYTFASTDDYYVFEEEVYDLGLNENYAVTSPDLTEFEQRMTPLNTLSKMAGWFLLVILLIGGVILVVLNIFSVRERKYEVGVLTAMGMKKWKVATQFVCEILIVTMIAVILGAGIGAVSALPVTNALLEEQATSQTSMGDKINGNFGRPGSMGGSFGGGAGMAPPSGGGFDFGNIFGGAAADYITEVNSAMNLGVVLEMIGVGLLLTLTASAASVLFIMRYDPLRILQNRD